MLGSALGYTLHLVLAREITSDVHPAFLAFWRSFAAFLICSPLLLSGAVKLTLTRWPLLLVRSLLGSMGFLLSLLAIWDIWGLKLSEFNALSFTRPLFVTILAAIVLKETVGRHRAGAVIIGFIGVLVMTLLPVLLGAKGGVSLNLGSLMAIGSALCFAGAIILVKSLSDVHSPIALLIWANLLSSIMLLPFAIIFWVMPDAQTWLLIAGMALTGVAAQFCYISAMSVGDASFLSPMDYLRLPLAALADWLMIRLLPGPYVWLGAAIIVAATLYITLREASLRRRAIKPIA